MTEKDHRVSFYLEEGVSLEACVVTRKVDASVIVWQTRNKIVAVGWEDGTHRRLFEVDF